MQLSSIKIFKRILSNYILPYKKTIFLSIFSMIIIALTSSFQVWLIKPSLDRIFIEKNKDLLLYLPVTVIIISVIKAIAEYFQNYTMKYVGQKVISDLQMELYDHLIYSDIDFIQQYSTGKIISKFNNDINIMRDSLSDIITSMVRDFFTMLFLIILMFNQSTALSLIAFVVFPTAIFPIIRFGRRMRKISRNTQEEIGNFAARLDDSFRLIKIVKSYCSEELEKHKANKLIKHIFDFYIKSIRIQSLISPIMGCLSGIAIASVIWYGGGQIINGQTTAGSFFSFIVAFIAAYKPVKGLAFLNSRFQEGLAAASRIFSILDHKNNIKDGSTRISDYKLTGNIEFSNVNFTINNKNILKNISFSITAGKTIAFVGPSGGGKSTIINLLMRFYDIDDGYIKIDNHDIRDLELSYLRSNISFVSQENMLFDNDIKSNIAYPDITIDDYKIKNAASMASADDFINKLQYGYKTMIGQNGIKLSGGQKQRIAIARAFLKDANILLLDEATSSLDNNTENSIKNNLELYKNKKTIIIIAHRLSTIINADLIYVIKDGMIIEYGNHEELLNQRGEYNKLYEKEKH